MLWSSWHNHTGDGPRFSYCADRDLSPDVYRRCLRSGPWQAFAITDHAFSIALPDEEPWPFQWYYKPQRLWEHREFRDDKTAQYLERLREVCDGEKIFGGMETEVAADGSLTMDAGLWPYLDVVIGSVHFLPRDVPDPYAAYVAQLDMLLAHPIDILGHPFRELSRLGPVPDEVIDETLQRAKDARVAVEINAHIPYDGDAVVLARAVGQGLRIAFGIDTHARAELDLHTYYRKVIADSGLREADIRPFRPTIKTAKPRALTR